MKCTVAHGGLPENLPLRHGEIVSLTFNYA